MDHERKDEFEFNQTEKPTIYCLVKNKSNCYLPRGRRLVVVQVLQRAQGQLEQQVAPQQRARLLLGLPQRQRVLLLLGVELLQQARVQHQVPGPQLRQQEALLLVQQEAHLQVQQERRHQVQQPAQQPAQQEVGRFHRRVERQLPEGPLL